MIIAYAGEHWLRIPTYLAVKVSHFFVFLLSCPSLVTLVECTEYTKQEKAFYINYRSN